MEEKNQPYNILFLDFSTSIGGAEVSTRLLLKYMDKKYFKPFFVLPGKGQYHDQIVKMDIPVTIVPLNQLKLNSFFKYIQTIRELAKFVKVNNIDLVVCTMDPCNQYALPVARLTRVPIVCHTRNLIPDFRSFWRTFLHFPDVLIANSKATAESYRPFIRKRQKVKVVYNGVDFEEFTPSTDNHTARRKFGVDADKFLIGMIGRISRNKRQDFFIKAFSEIVKMYPHVCALIVGETKIDHSEDYLKELRQMVKEKGLTGKVIFTGFVDEMKELYAALDLLVLPSQAEPFGRVLIEAMAMELAVVATKAGGATEIVEDGVTGLLVLPDDINGFIAAIIRMIKNENERILMGKTGRKRVENMFSIRKNVEETQKVYLEAIS